MAAMSPCHRARKIDRELSVSATMNLLVEGNKGTAVITYLQYIFLHAYREY
jgi:hypothetical protein